MHISAYEPFTLLDYPGKIATTVFTPGCVFRCPFCHNPELVEPKGKEAVALFQNNKVKEFLSFLDARQGKLDGVCITGGEPTLQTDLLVFIKQIKSKGFLVKLDTNGLFPDIVRDIMKEKVVDYWAMDIKHTPKKYHLAAGKDVPIDKISESASLIMNSGVEYEFRTTVVPGIHEEKDFSEIGRWISGAQAYYLQEFRDIKILDENLRKKASQGHIDLDRVAKRMKKYVDKIDIRR